MSAPYWEYSEVGLPWTFLSDARCGRLKRMGSENLLTLKFCNSRCNRKVITLQQLRICPFRTWDCVTNMVSGEQ